jgi:hypothetical protein
MEVPQIKDKIRTRLDNVEMEIKSNPMPDPDLQVWYDALTWVMSLFTPTPSTQSPIKPRLGSSIPQSHPHNTILASTPIPGENWLNHLPTQEDMYFIPGQITCQRPKAIAFQISGKNQIWIPLSVVNTTLSNIKGVYVKQWWLRKNLDKVM